MNLFESLSDADEPVVRELATRVNRRGKIKLVAVWHPVSDRRYLKLDYAFKSGALHYQGVYTYGMDEFYSACLVYEELERKMLGWY